MLEWKKDIINKLAEEIESAVYDIDIVNAYVEANEGLTDYAKIYAIEQLDDVLSAYCPSDILNMPDGKFEPSDYYFMLVKREWGDELVSGCDLEELWEEYTGEKLANVAQWLLTHYEVAEENCLDDEYKQALARIIEHKTDNPDVLECFFFFAFENGILELNEDEGELVALQEEFNQKYSQEDKATLINGNMVEFVDNIVNNVDVSEFTKYLMK